MQKINIRYYIGIGGVACATLTCVHSDRNDKLEVFRTRVGYSNCLILSDSSWKSLEHTIQQLLKDVSSVSSEREDIIIRNDKEYKKFEIEAAIKVKELEKTQPEDHAVTVGMARTL